MTSRKPPSKKSKNRQQKKPMKAPKPARSLDASAAAYARLLMDPCNAPVVHPIYPGGDAGYLFRAETFWTPAGAGATAGYLHWTPGYTNFDRTQLIFGETTGGTVATVASVLPQSYSPGAAFLASNCKAARCVAACLKITYSGSESGRAGRIHFGQTTGGLVDAGSSYTPDAVAQSLQNYGRTPAETVEISWKPNIADTEFNDPSESASALFKDRKGSITVAYAGLPAAVGPTFHFTAIYEWVPATGLGLGGNTMGKAVSRNTLDDVLDAIASTGYKYVQGAFAAAGAGLAAGAVSSISRTFGIIPSQAYTRRLNFY